MHKHFRMIALSQYLQSSAHDAEKNKHLQIPGIWKKLGSLYNLEALDERVGDVLEVHLPEGAKDLGCRRTLSIMVTRLTAMKMGSPFAHMPYQGMILAT